MSDGNWNYSWGANESDSSSGDPEITGHAQVGNNSGTFEANAQGSYDPASGAWSESAGIGGHGTF